MNEFVIGSLLTIFCSLLIGLLIVIMAIRQVEL